MRSVVVVLALALTVIGCRELVLPASEETAHGWPVSVHVEHERLGALAGVEILVTNVDYQPAGAQHWQRVRLDATGDAALLLESPGPYDVVLSDGLPLQLTSWRFLALDPASSRWDLLYETVVVPTVPVPPDSSIEHTWRAGQFYAVRWDSVPPTSRYFPRYVRNWSPLQAPDGTVLQEAPRGEWFPRIAFAAYAGMRDLRFWWHTPRELDLPLPAYGVERVWLELRGTPRSVHADSVTVRLRADGSPESASPRAMHWLRDLALDARAVSVLAPDDAFTLELSGLPGHLGVLRNTIGPILRRPSAAAGDTLRVVLGEFSLAIRLENFAEAPSTVVVQVEDSLFGERITPREGLGEVFTVGGVHLISARDASDAVLAERVVDVVADTLVTLRGD